MEEKDLAGWWFGSSIGGEEVWAKNAQKTPTPPLGDWEILAEGGEDTLAAVIEELNADPDHPRFGRLREAIDDQIDHFAYLELEMAAYIAQGLFIPADRTTTSVREASLNANRVFHAIRIHEQTHCLS